MHLGWAWRIEFSYRNIRVFCPDPFFSNISIRKYIKLYAGQDLVIFFGNPSQSNNFVATVPVPDSFENCEVKI